jgi:hypothetical protein
MKTLTFRTPTNEKVKVTLLESVEGLDPLDRPILLLRVELSWKQYQSIAKNEWFNYHAALRPPTADAMLEAKLPVQLEIGLRAPLLARAATALEAVESTQIPAMVNEAGTGQYAFIADTESWIVYVVKQQLPSLPSMEADEGISAGFSTRWNTTPAPQSLISEVKAVLDEWDLEFEQVKENLFRATIRIDDDPWICLVQIDPDNQYISVYSVLPAFVPEAHRATALIGINNLNYDFAIGSFEMDTTDGELRFRASVDVEGTTDVAPIFRQLLKGSISTMPQYLPMLRGLRREVIHR